MSLNAADGLYNLDQALAVSLPGAAARLRPGQRDMIRSAWLTTLLIHTSRTR